MPEMSLTNHEEAFCLQHRKPYSIHAATNPLRFRSPRLALTRGFLMTFRAVKPPRIFAIVALILACSLPAGAQEQRRAFYTPPAADSIHAVAAEHGMVVAQEKIAAQIGADVLKHGGNAVDAAVATRFAIAVTYPRAGNIGWGGFLVVPFHDNPQTLRAYFRATGPTGHAAESLFGAATHTA